ncbi:MAG: N-formylglutamate amidohydrolase [Proteobacteria bacterium]|nr:N-formylglutamate amidohydrolase [Pseudomonadota bacterium]
MLKQHDVLEILAPAQWQVPMVFNSPHSGRQLPKAFVAQSKLALHQLRLSEDTFVDELFSGCVSVGAPMLRALLSRSFIDLNREPYELDPRMFIEDVPGYANVASARVACGLGTIPRIVAEGLDIYRGRIEIADALQRIESVYRPYHRTLSLLLDEAHRATGFVLLFDCHSMPASAVSGSQRFRGQGVDVVLGDRFGAACDPGLADWVERQLASAGLHVSRNRPYAGGFITETHGNPRNGRHALQIEVNRSLYMNEATLERSRDFALLKALFDDLARRLGDLTSAMAGIGPSKQAAE